MYFFRNNDDYPEKVSPIAILLAINQLHQCRPDEMVGAHARPYNAHSIGICYEGGLDANGKPADTRAPAQKHALITLLRCLRYDYLDAEIIGHRDLPWVKSKY